MAPRPLALPAASACLATLAVAAAPALAPTTTATAGAATVRATDTVTLDGVTVHLRARTREVVTVHHTRGYHARVTLWALRDGRWQRRLQAADGRTGYGGLVRGTKRVQGTGTTPLGSYGLISSFGTHARRAAWDLSYRRIRGGDYWVEDNGSAYYNRYRNKSHGGFRWWLPASDDNSSERLADHPHQYELAIVTSFNRRQVRHRGAGIFLHVNGSGATAGCVSAPRRFILRVAARLTPGQAPVIAIGR